MQENLFKWKCDARAVLQDLVVMVLDVMGVPASAAEPRNTLADMGIDSMQQARPSQG